MSNISVANSTYTTGGLDTRATLDGTSQATFQQMNGAASGVVAIETVLGDGPTLRGSLADLVTRLAVALNAAGEIGINTNGVFAGLTDKYGLIADSGNKKLVPKNIMPIGTILMTGLSSAPAHWLLCRGQAVSRTTYADLFDAIGTQFGVGDGSTTFNLPDLRGRVPMGQDNMGGVDAARVTAASTGGSNADTLGGVGGAETHTLVDAEVPQQTVTVQGASGGAGALQGFQYITNVDTDNDQTVNSEGGGGAHSNTQPWIALTYIIYAGVV